MMSNTTLTPRMRLSADMVQQKYRGKWIPTQVVGGMPSSVILPILEEEPLYGEWTREVTCYCVISRKPKHVHILFPEKLTYPLPEDYQPTPLQTDCVFWYHDVAVVLDAVEVFQISLQEDPLTVILTMLKEKEGDRNG